MTDLYNDGYLCIGIKDEKTAYYSDRYCGGYMETSLTIAKYVIKRLKKNEIIGYNLIDYLCMKHGY